MKHVVAVGLIALLGAGAPAQAPDYTVRLTVPAAAEPSPALRFPLMPELREQTPGNAALLYYRAFSPEWLTHRQPDQLKTLNAWRENTAQKPGEELRWVLKYRPLEELDRAARRSYCDFELNERLRKEGMAMLLPEVQSMREFANLLALRARFQIEAGEHEQVLRTLQTGLTMSRHIADGPTLIQTLVGAAIHAIMMGELERWIQTPGAPNLYWSLTNLPRPFIDLRRPLQGERFFLDAFLPDLREAMAERRPPRLGPDDIVQWIPTLTAEQANKEEVELLAKFGMAFYVAKVYPQAKLDLADLGWTPRQIERLSMSQAVLIREVVNYDRIYDDMVKWYGVPFPEARARLANAQRDLRGSMAEHGVGPVLAKLLLPALEKVMFASVRLDRRIAALRCVEAARLHAAEKGRWPESLEDIDAVPIPPDPATGKPFEYRVEGDMFTLSAAPPGKEAPNASNALRYEITLKK
jgi:hypothetical protein